MHNKSATAGPPKCVPVHKYACRVSKHHQCMQTAVSTHSNGIECRPAAVGTPYYVLTGHIFLRVFSQMHKQRETFCSVHIITLYQIPWRVAKHTKQCTILSLTIALAAHADKNTFVQLGNSVQLTSSKPAWRQQRLWPRSCLQLPPSSQVGSQQLDSACTHAHTHTA